MSLWSPIFNIRVDPPETRFELTRDRFDMASGIVMRKELEDWQPRHHRDNFERER